ncbi:hypothetical protein [Chryseobacterium sp. c4a]|uniref:hypothetical protein n=1 Tax=Chryseobacterium sp. c4a TaxID=1573582 RepID=UPI00135750A4|nr:hypothetical protein [Chryseobacterium sp. c4a]
MITTTINLHLIGEKIRYLSTDHHGNFIAITSQNRIVSSALEVPLELRLDIEIVKIINEEKILIVLGNSDLIENALIIDYQGNIQVQFSIGIYINDIIINGKKIIVSYYDQGVMGSNGPNNDALAVFNLKGQQVFGFNSSTLEDQLIDCYCTANLGNNKIVFYGYGNFSLQELDLNTLKLIVHETPPQCIGATSLSTKADNLIFHSTYKDKTSFFVWNLQSNHVNQIPSEFKNINATDHGMFYKIDEKSFILIAPLHYI